MTGPRTTIKEDELHKFLEIDSTHFDAATSDDSDISEMSGSNPVSASEDNNLRKEESCHSCPNSNYASEDIELKPMSTKEPSFPIEAQGGDSECGEANRVSSSSKEVNGKKSLEGLKILLAEDTPVLQRVATIMLEKMGASVVAVGDGQQAVDALNFMLGVEDCRRKSLQKERNTRSQTDMLTYPSYDLVLMDCQMPKMDGYEATRAIRKSEMGTGLHIPIVALTAHAMSCDEAKCLEVGMGAYLTKPIDFKKMMSTILSLTKRAS